MPPSPATNTQKQQLLIHITCPPTWQPSHPKPPSDSDAPDGEIIPIYHTFIIASSAAAAATTATTTSSSSSSSSSIIIIVVIVVIIVITIVVTITHLVLCVQDSHKILVLCNIVNIFRLLRHVLHCLPSGPTVSMGRVLQRAHGASICIKAGSVLKHISGFSRQPNVNNKFSVLEAVRRVIGLEGTVVL